MLIGGQVSRDPSSLEDLCVMAYLRYLENEIVTYVSLTQSKSHLVKGVAKRMIQVRGKTSSCSIAWKCPTIPSMIKDT